MTELKIQPNEEIVVLRKSCIIEIEFINIERLLTPFSLNLHDFRFEKRHSNWSLHLDCNDTIVKKKETLW